MTMQSRRNRAFSCFGMAAASLLALLSPVSAAAQEAEPDPIAGTYDGSQTEMAAWLELGEGGRYRYALSYGAVDEYSAGTWRAEEAGVVLTSDPSRSPEFEMLGDEPGSGPEDALTIRLEDVGSLPLSLFGAVVERGDGTSFTADFSEDGLEIPVAEGEHIVSVSLTLPMFEVQGEPVPLTQASGNTLYFAFHPNDLGFKAFNQEILPERDGGFMLERYGREVVFRKMEE